MTSVDLPEAVLWDLDGTLVDTEPSWLAAEMALARRHRAHWTAEHGRALVGSELITSGRYIRDVMGLRLTPEQIVDQLLDDMVERVASGVTARPGALDLLAECHALGVPCALVTMSYRRMVDPIVRQLAPDGFAAIVTGDSVSHGKPHPEAYQRAARLLGVTPQRCLAIEDSVNGAASAEAAGARVIVVPNRVPVPPSHGRVIVPTLRGMALTDLVEKWATAPSDESVNIRSR